MIAIVREARRAASGSISAVGVAGGAGHAAHGLARGPGVDPAGKSRGRKRDLLGEWLARGLISLAQHDAGRWFERLYERSGIHGHASIDLRRPMVDGKRAPHETADSAVLAKIELQGVLAALGTIDGALVCRVLGEGQDPGGSGDDADKRYFGRRVRDALGVLAAQRRMALMG